LYAQFCGSQRRSSFWQFHHFPLYSQQTPLFAAIVQYQTECAHSDVMVNTWAYIDVTSFTQADYIITSYKLALMQNTLFKSSK
jgi:hypothetical protein